MIGTSPQEPENNLALVVDDEPTNRLILSALLKNIGYRVAVAENGQQAIDLFVTDAPDIVFMDIMMPVMDGYEATAKIKALSADSFVPVIVLTAVSDNDSLAECIKAGGDDVMTKPFEHDLLASKIYAMMRIRDLHNKISTLYSQVQREEEIAEEIYSNAVQLRNVGLEHIDTYLKPAMTFSGDMLLTGYGPGRDFHLMLGDFTGHGLAAALGALPTSELFREMTTRGFSGQEILTRINQRLVSLFPVDIFLAACYITINPDLQSVSVFNCAMPEVLIVDGVSGKVKQSIPSQSLPIGLISKFDAAQVCQRVDLALGDRIILHSDGLIESQNHHGELFGEERLVSIVESKNEPCSARLIDALNVFCAETTQRDDISLVEVPCVPEIIPSWGTRDVAHYSPAFDAIREGPDSASECQFDLTLRRASLRCGNPVPQIIDQIQSVVAVPVDTQALFSILNELYGNALDHGILGLRSELKSSSEGFAQYYQERERRLSELQEASISISVKVVAGLEEGSVEFCVTDSGPGFDYEALNLSIETAASASGRGLPLVKLLSTDFKISPPGNKVTAVFEWSAE